METTNKTSRAIQITAVRLLGNGRVTSVSACALEAASRARGKMLQTNLSHSPSPPLLRAPL